MSATGLTVLRGARDNGATPTRSVARHTFAIEHAEAVVVAVLAISAVVLSIIATRRAPNAWPDSASYIAGARNIAAGNGYLGYSQQALTVWPPAFSMMLALAIRLGIGVIERGSMD